MIVYYIIAAKVADGETAPKEGLVEGALEVGLEGAPEIHNLQTVVVTGPFPRDFFPPRWR